ncbi:MAG: vWA domain-containing protein, partial [Myxococcota bacterium]
MPIPWLMQLGPGCLEFWLDPVDPPDPLPQQIAVRESFVQSPLPKVDLLLVIDDTASMAQEQASLAVDFAVLLDELDDRAIGWQVGVVTTDMTLDDAGWLLGSPWILTPDLADRDAVFADMVEVGTAGAGPEAGLAAAIRAVELAAPGGPNAGFRRPDALLHVVFVSDTDDQSEDWLGDAPEQAFLAFLDAEAAATGLPARASALVGPVPSGCTSVDGTAQAAVRYGEVVDTSGGVSVSICAADLGPVLASLSEASVAWRTEFPLRSVPVTDSVRVRIDDAPTDDGWATDPDVPAVRFELPPP